MNLLVFIRSYIYIMLIILAATLSGCKDDITSPPTKPKYTSEIQGKVILENQTEHSNALVYLDSLNRGVGTDSSGLYSILFTNEDSIYNGVFKLYFYVNDYEMDSAYYVLENGKVKLDSLDVDSEGNLPTKELEQLLLIEGWTDKQEYRRGDTIRFTARFTNISDRKVRVFIYSVFNAFGHVSLYNENYPPVSLTTCFITDTELLFFLNPKQFYEGSVTYIIPPSYYCFVNNPPVLPDFYIVITDLFIENRFVLPFNKFEWFIYDEWFKMHKGESPKFDVYPNKYKYPIIKIIE